jgi:hypothetical protein
MKLIRLLILFGNISLIMLIAYLGYYFFLQGILTRGSGFFDHIQIVADPIEDIFPKDVEKRMKDESEYVAIVAWLGSPAREEERPEMIAPPPVEPDLERLKREVQIKSVVYNPVDPSRSGIHVIVGAIPRFFLSGDNEQLSSSLDFVLTNVKEITPGEEYTLVFQKGDSKIVELPYRKSNR